MKEHLIFQTNSKKREQLEFLEFLNKEQRKTILEIGCGPGWDAQFVQGQGVRVFAIDNAPTMVKLTNNRGIPAQVLDCYELDQMNETFDAVYTIELPSTYTEERYRSDFQFDF